MAPRERQEALKAARARVASEEKSSSSLCDVILCEVFGRNVELVQAALLQFEEFCGCCAPYVFLGVETFKYRCFCCVLLLLSFRIAAKLSEAKRRVSS